MTVEYSPSTQPLLASFIESSELEQALKTDRALRLFTDIRARLDGTHNIDDLARDAGVSTAELGSTLSALAQQGMVIDANGLTSANSTDEILEAFASESRFWSREILTLTFWRKLSVGDASPNLVIGWVIELYHYATAANEYMAAAVAYCHDDIRTRRRLVDRYFEQHLQSQVLLEGLVVSGMETERVLKAFPLASTRALINFLTELAIADWLAFSGAVEILYAVNRGTLNENVEAFHDSLIEKYPFGSDPLRSVSKYAISSVRARQQNGLLLKEIISSGAVEGVGIGKRLATALRDTYEHFALFFEGLEDYYSDPHVLLPRRPVDLRTEL